MSAPIKNSHTARLMNGQVNQRYDQRGKRNKRKRKTAHVVTLGNLSAANKEIGPPRDSNRLFARIKRIKNSAQLREELTGG